MGSRFCSFLSATDNYGIINFGDSGDNNIGQILYYHGDNSLSFVNNAQTGIKIDGIGAVTMPLQPCFLAYVSSTQSDLSNNDTIVFPEISGTDRNGDFTSNTFTAPVAGLYQFNVSISVTELDEDATYNRVTLVTSNRIYNFNITSTQSFNGSDPDYYVFMGSTLADMDAADTAYCRWSQSGGSDLADVFDSSYFSGYLVC